MPAHIVAEEFRLDGCLVDEVLRRAATEDYRGGARTADDDVGRLDDVTDDVDVAGARHLLTRLRQAHANGGVRNGRAEDRHVRAIGARQDAVATGRLPQMSAEAMQKFATRVRTRLERGCEVGDPVV